MQKKNVTYIIIHIKGNSKMTMEFLLFILMETINCRSKNGIIINACALNEFDYPLFSTGIPY